MLGQLLNIQRFCTQDGPGIRTTVFLKGCPLRCAWCSNPESQAGQVQYAIDAQICQGCQTCRHVCPHGAVEVLQSGVCAIAQELCRSCAACHGACPAQAVKRYGYAATVEEVLAEVLRDMPYYRRTGGGLTVSGGEPAVQWQFTRELLRRAKEAGVGTLVETAGAVGWEQLWAALEEADIVYFDLKFASSELHKRYTGMDNALILDNLRNTSARKENLVVRIPLIPGINDAPEELGRMAELICRLPHVSRIGLLPYHRYGVKKYALLGRDYALEQVPVQAEQSVAQARDLLARATGREVRSGI